MIQTGCLIHLRAPKSEDFPSTLCSLPMHLCGVTDLNQVLPAVLWRGDSLRLAEPTPNVAEGQFPEKGPCQGRTPQVC